MLSWGILTIVLLLLSSCDDDPTWGLQHGELDIVRFESSLSDLEVDPDRNVLYIADQIANVVHIMDMDTDEVVAEIPVGSKPQKLVLDPAGEQLFVALKGGHAVAVVDPDARIVERTLPVPYEAMFLDVSGDGRVFVGAGTISDGETLALDSTTGDVLHNFSTGGGWGTVGEIVAVGDSILLLARGEDLHKWDIRDRNQAVYVASGEMDDYHVNYHMEVSSDGGLMYASGTGGKTTYVEVFKTLDLSKVGELNTEQPVVYACLAPGGGRAYVATMMQSVAQNMSATTQVLGFNTGTYARSAEYVALGRMDKTSMAVSADESKLYVVVDNPYVIYDNPTQDRRQDIQVISLR